MGLFSDYGTPAGYTTTMATRGLGSTMQQPVFDQLSGTLNGDYLHGGAGFDAAQQAAYNRITPQVQSAFSGGGRLQSGLAQTAQTQALGDSFAGLYNNERNRQLQAAQVAPSVDGTATQSDPYFNNDLATYAGLLGLGGSLLGSGGVGGLLDTIGSGASSAYDWLTGGGGVTGSAFDLTGGGAPLTTPTGVMGGSGTATAAPPAGGFDIGGPGSSIDLGSIPTPPSSLVTDSLGGLAASPGFSLSAAPGAVTAAQSLPGFIGGSSVGSTAPLAGTFDLTGGLGAASAPATSAAASGVSGVAPGFGSMAAAAPILGGLAFGAFIKSRLDSADARKSAKETAANSIVSSLNATPQNPDGTRTIKLPDGTVHNVQWSDVDPGSREGFSAANAIRTADGGVIRQSDPGKFYYTSPAQMRAEEVSKLEAKGPSKMTGDDYIRAASLGAGMTAPLKTVFTTRPPDSVLAPRTRLEERARNQGGGWVVVADTSRLMGGR